MQNIIDFFKENTMTKISFCLSIISFCLSIYNFIRNLWENHKNLEVSFGFMEEPGCSAQHIQINVINKSCKQITISNIKIKTDSGVLEMINECVRYMSTTHKSNGEKIIDNEYYTSTTPFYICELGCYSGCFMISKTKKRNYLKCNENVEIILGTNRGKVKKKITTPDSYENPRRIRSTGS